jgi:hypothetical protein
MILVGLGYDLTCTDKDVYEGAEVDNPIEVENDEGVVNS